MQAASGMCFFKMQNPFGGKHVKAQGAPCTEFGKSNVVKGGNAPIQNFRKQLTLSKRNDTVSRKATSVDG